MILTCPECATRYSLPDASVGRAGRSVRCTNCGTVWRAELDPEAAPAPPAPPPPPKSEPVLPAPGPDPPLPDPEEDFSAAAQRRASILKEKKDAAERKARREGVIVAAVWAALVAAIALFVVLAVIFRAQVVKMWPATAGAYAAIGLPVNASGLLLGKVQAFPSVIAGRRALEVTGVLTNASPTPRPAPAFRVSILDKAGHAIAQKTIPVTAVALKVGEARRFRLDYADPPAGADNVEVTLALPDAAPARAAKAGPF